MYLFRSFVGKEFPALFRAVVETVCLGFLWGINIELSLFAGTFQRVSLAFYPDKSAGALRFPFRDRAFAGNYGGVQESKD